MSDSLSERRLAENEVYFRQKNESVQQSFDRLREIAEEDNQESLVEVYNMPLSFYCECSDEDCRQRIQLTLTDYKKAHKNRDTFVVAPGHALGDIEKVIAENPEYLVVEKYTQTPLTASKLNKTDIKKKT